MDNEKFAAHFLENSIAEFTGVKALADKAMAQVSDKEFFTTIDPEANSIAVIVKHVAGNLYSRWTDFLMSDGEKPTRNRDGEFELLDESRETIISLWEGGWGVLFDTLRSLSVTDVMNATVFIRSEPHTVVQAIQRQLTHYADHTGQIILLAKHFRSSEWQTLSIARNRSADFNRSKGHSN